ncbi:putative protein Networked (NET), actin-binding (NAB) [Dioscorea sansibarensis]
MLQRAASNAYSWWWASHIRTSQSKWLDNNLQEMEQKTKSMLKIIDEEADSFAKRAEMYYKKRPELMNYVEETYKAYKALAERYDRISGELHKANHTIATAFPDQVQFAIQDEDDDGLPKAITSIDSSKIHKAPAEIPQISSRNKTRQEDQQSDIKKLKHRRMTSQISKEKAQEEIDRLQKAILVLQTEKEFIKSSYESGFTKFLDIEREISEMQEEVCFLQDHFSTSSVIDDDEARALMAAAALKSCEDTLVNLQEQQNKTAQEAWIESERIKKAELRLKAFRGQPSSQPSQMETRRDVSEEHEHVCVLRPERLELQSFCDKVKQHFEMNSEASVVDLAEKIDELVEKVISLEITISSQYVEIRKLRSETDELHKHLQGLEDEKTAPTNDANILSARLKQAEEKLQMIQHLERCVKDEKNILTTHFTEACHSLNDLSDKLQSPNCRQDQVKNEVAKIPNHKDKETKVDAESCTPYIGSQPDNPSEKEVPCIQDIQEKEKTGSKVGGDSSGLKVLKEKSLSEADDNVGLSDEPDDQELQQLLSNGVEGREKIFAQYTSILRNYKEMKKKLSEVEKKNQDSLAEIIAQLRELKSSNAMKDEEIRLLRDNLSLLKENSHENNDPSLVKTGNPFLNKLESFARFSKLTALSSKRRNIDTPEDRNAESKAGTGAAAPDIADAATSPCEEISAHCAEEPHLASPIEEKFRRDIDAVLEENLEFWLRFSATYHTVQKLQTTFEELQAEVEKLKDSKAPESTTASGSSSSSSPLDKRLRELKTELQVWLEQNAMLRGELKQRFSSLCEIQDDIAGVLKESTEGGEVQLTSYQAAKFQGEVLNMQQENNKVSNELQAGLDHVRGLQVEVEKALSKLQESFEISGPRSSHGNHHQFPPMRNLSSKTKIPLRSFLYGVKPKRPSIFSCMSPALQKQYSHMRAGFPT